MVISCDPKCKFQKNLLICPKSAFDVISGKVTKFMVEKLSISEVNSQKPHGGWKPHSAFRVNMNKLYFNILWTKYS